MALAALSALFLAAMASPAAGAPGLLAADRLPKPEVPAEVRAIPVGYLVDMGSGQVLYARQPERRFLPASMTKVMTAYVAFELIARGKLKPEQRFIVRPETAAEWNGKGTSLFLRGHESVSVDELLHGIATASANDACVVLAESYAGSVPGWTALMNAQARRLGLANSRFHTPNGWPDKGQTYVSAQDLVTLGRAMIERHPALYRRYFGQKQMDWHGVTLRSHDPTVGVVPGADGIKTGHTNEAGYNFLGSAERNGRRLMMVIGGAQTARQRAEASRALLEWGFTAWKNRRLFAQGAKVADARVQGGDARSVPLIAPHTIGHASYNPQESIHLRLIYKGPLKAPIAKGAQVAQLEIVSSDGETNRVPLVTGAAVGKAGPLDRLANGLMSLVP